MTNYKITNRQRKEVLFLNNIELKEFLKMQRGKTHLYKVEEITNTAAEILTGLFFFATSICMLYAFITIFAN
jgi:hypothetical protein